MILWFVKVLTRFFWPLLFLMLSAALAVVLWSGRTEEATFGDLACSFEDLSPGCQDSLELWRGGLDFYDSALAATGDTLSSLKNLLWSYWNLKFAGAGEPAVNEESISALGVLKSKKSGCLGLSWLAMMVAEQRQIPLEVILLPGHVYLRYGNEGAYQNLEPNRQGFRYSDEEYREKYKKGPWTGLEFKPLSAAHFMGLAAFNRGNLYLNSDLRRALTWYRMAETFFPEYPGISANQKIAKSRLPDSL